MFLVRSDTPSPAFVGGGRDPDSITHREDGSPGWVAYVEELRPGDEEITEAEAAIERRAIRDYNAALPPPPEPPPDREQEAIDAFAGGDDAKQTEAMRAIAKRQATV